MTFLRRRLKITVPDQKDTDADTDAEQITTESIARRTCFWVSNLGGMVWLQFTFANMDVRKDEMFRIFLLEISGPRVWNQSLLTPS